MIKLFDVVESIFCMVVILIGLVEVLIMIDGEVWLVILLWFCWKLGVCVLLESIFICLFV